MTEAIYKLHAHLNTKQNPPPFLFDSNTDNCDSVLVTTEYSLEQLAGTVQEWCRAHSIQPANGQVSQALSERNIRYYRSLGLLDAPPGAYLRSFTEKHRLQLIAIRIHQAQGIPLRKIQEHLYGKTEIELRHFVAKAGNELEQAPTPLLPTAAFEQWRVVPLTEDLLMVSRQGRSLPPHLIRHLQQVLDKAGWSDRSDNTPTPN